MNNQIKCTLYFLALFTALSALLYAIQWVYGDFMPLWTVLLIEAVIAFGSGLATSRYDDTL